MATDLHDTNQISCGVHVHGGLTMIHSKPEQVQRNTLRRSECKQEEKDIHSKGHIDGFPMYTDTIQGRGFTTPVTQDLQHHYTEYHI